MQQEGGRREGGFITSRNQIYNTFESVIVE